MPISPSTEAKAGTWRRPSRRAAPAAALCLVILTAANGCGGPQPSTQPAGDSARPAVSSAPVAQPPDEQLDLGNLIHIVQPGDTLYSLAERYYGHGKYYGKILAANRNRLEDPRNLPVGMKLIIRP